jgi:hypothetical protein
MPESAGPALDREIARRLFGEEPPRVPPYSTDNASADLLLWQLAQAGVAFKVQELEGRHYCMLWNGPGRGLTTRSALHRPLAICHAALDLCARWPLPRRRKLPAAAPVLGAQA